MDKYCSSWEIENRWYSIERDDGDIIHIRTDAGLFLDELIADANRGAEIAEKGIAKSGIVEEQSKKYTLEEIALAFDIAANSKNSFDSCPDWRLFVGELNKIDGYKTKRRLQELKYIDAQDFVFDASNGAVTARKEETKNDTD